MSTREKFFLFDGDALPPPGDLVRRSLICSQPQSDRLLLEGITGPTEGVREQRLRAAIGLRGKLGETFTSYPVASFGTDWQTAAYLGATAIHLFGRGFRNPHAIALIGDQIKSAGGKVVNNTDNSFVVDLPLSGRDNRLQIAAFGQDYEDLLPQEWSSYGGMVRILGEETSQIVPTLLADALVKGAAVINPDYRRRNPTTGEVLSFVPYLVGFAHNSIGGGYAEAYILEKPDVLQGRAFLEAVGGERRFPFGNY